MLHGCHGLLDILNYVTAYYFSNAISAVQKEASSVEKGVQIEYIIKHGRKHSPAVYSFFFPQGVWHYCIYSYLIQEVAVIFTLLFYMLAIV